MNSWESWKHQYRKQIEHIAGYEERFVDDVLRKLPNISPSDVVPQYHFIDDKGGNRYIDFVILNEEKGFHLPIELDGTYKDIHHHRWKDFLERQNSLITKFGIVLRFSNHQMLTDSGNVIYKIHNTLRQQATSKISKERTVVERNKLVQVYERKLKKVAEEQGKSINVAQELNELKIAIERINEKETQGPQVSLMNRYVKWTILSIVAVGVLSVGARQDHYKLELLSEEAIRSMSNHLL